MFASLLITFRETLEASLIIGIIFGYLKKTTQTRYNKYVWYGVVAGVITSGLGAWLFHTIAGGFEGKTEQIFEGVTMLIGAGLLTTMILWVTKQQQRIALLKERIAHSVEVDKKIELFGLVFVAVLREGIETVIFLNAAWFAATDNKLLGALCGIVIAIAVGYALYKGFLKLHLKTFFTATSILLILFAAGLMAHSVHEFEEAGLIPIVIEHLWDINPAVHADGSYPALHENGTLGQILKGLFGYNGNPSLVEVGVYVTYLVGIGYIWRRNTKNHNPQAL